jgi:alanine racemase
VLLPDDLGAVRPGDEVVFIGRSGAERILAEDVARQLDTINYEVTCDVSPRVVRRYRESPESAGSFSPQSLASPETVDFA